MSKKYIYMIEASISECELMFVKADNQKEAIAKVVERFMRKCFKAKLVDTSVFDRRLNY